MYEKTKKNRRITSDSGIFIFSLAGRARNIIKTFLIVILSSNGELLKNSMNDQ